VATIVLFPAPASERTIAAAAPATARTRQRSTGQIQSPGYHPRRRCHAPAACAAPPRRAGRRPRWRAADAGRIRGSTPGPAGRELRSVDTPAPLAGRPGCSLLPAVLRRRRQSLEQFLSRLDRGRMCPLLRADSLPARRAELRFSWESGAALRACDDRWRRRSRAAAVGTEVRAPHNRRAACTTRCRRGAARADGGREEGFELLDPVVERDELVTTLDQQVLAELVAPEHLQHQSAKIAQPLLPHAQQCSALLPELAGGGEGSGRRGA